MNRCSYVAGRWSFRKFIVVILVAAVGSCSAAYAASYSHEEKSNKTIEIEGESRIIVTSKSGDITVVGEKGRKDIFLELTKKVRAESKEEAERLAELIGIEIERVGDDLKISTKYGKKGETKKSIFSYLLQRYPKMSMEISLLIPQELEVDVESASGDLSVSDVSAAVEATAASGDIDISDVGGFLKVVVASGQIKVEKIKGDAILSSASGDIYAREVAGNMDVHTASGDVELLDIGGDLELKTTSGDVRVDGVGDVAFRGTSGTARFIEVRGGVSAAAASGDLSFKLVPTADFDYEVSTSSGDIKLNFLKIMVGGYALIASTTTGDITANLPIKISKVGRNHIAGVVRIGKSRVVLETASGDISIFEPED